MMQMKRAVFVAIILLMAPGGAWAQITQCTSMECVQQQMQQQHGAFVLMPNQPPPSITIMGGVGRNGPLVTIRPDGTIEYGENYTPDAAAAAFWEAIGRGRCP